MTLEQKEFLSNLVQTSTPNLTPFFLRRYPVEQVEEILQETYLAACVEIETLIHHEKPEAWLFTTAMHRALRLRDKVKRDEIRNIELTAEILDERRDKTGDPRIVLSDSIDEILPRDTPEKDRKVLKMYYEQQMTTQEIAEELDTTPGNVRQLLNRARSRLKGSLGTTFLILLILM